MRDAKEKRRQVPARFRVKALKRPLSNPEFMDLFGLICSSEVSYTSKALIHCLHLAMYDGNDKQEWEMQFFHRVQNLILELQNLE